MLIFLPFFFFAAPYIAVEVVADKVFSVNESFSIHCTWLRTIDKNYPYKSETTITFLWQDSRSPEKGFVPICRQTLDNIGKCSSIYMFPHRTISVQPPAGDVINKKTILFKEILYEGDVKCSAKTVGEERTYESSSKTVKVPGKHVRFHLLIVSPRFIHSMYFVFRRKGLRLEKLLITDS